MIREQQQQQRRRQQTAGPAAGASAGRLAAPPDCMGFGRAVQRIGALGRDFQRQGMTYEIKVRRKQKKKRESIKSNTGDFCRAVSVLFLVTNVVSSSYFSN